MWLEPLRELDSRATRELALSAYIARKLDYSRSHPTASRLFAMEVAPGRAASGWGALRATCTISSRRSPAHRELGSADGRLRPVDPKHLIFAIWATTQHYADFGIQIRSLTGKGIEDAEFYDATRRMLADDPPRRRADAAGECRTCEVAMKAMSPCMLQ